MHEASPNMSRVSTLRSQKGCIYQDFAATDVFTSIIQQISFSYFISSSSIVLTDTPILIVKPPNL